VDLRRQRLGVDLANGLPHEDYGLTRRQLMRLAALATGVGLAGTLVTACTKEDLDKIKNRPMRREITTAAAAKDIASYQTAIAKMKALPSSDPRNWTRQAQIHDQKCRHASWLFFPWHRAYLFYFEKICQELSGDPTFALPYWNWTLHPQVPSVFWNTNSALFHSPRTATASSVASASFVGQSIIDDILNETNFLVFGGPATGLNDTAQFGPGYGRVEQTPHNYIHGFVGGTMGTFMSPLDPIFWTHHNRVDELWVEWNILRDNPNTDDSDWLNTEFNEFCDGKGNGVTIKVVATILMPFFSYRFDTQETP
jgi:tyrosinase